MQKKKMKKIIKTQRKLIAQLKINIEEMKDEIKTERELKEIAVQRIVQIKKKQMVNNTDQPIGYW